MPSDAFCCLRFSPIAQFCVCVCVCVCVCMPKALFVMGKYRRKVELGSCCNERDMTRGTHPIIHFYQSEEEEEDEDGDK